MKKLILGFILLVSPNVFAAPLIQVEIKDLTNLAGSTALEVCGVATHINGVKPLLITIKHDASSYTTLTDKDGKWCTVFKRWTNSGKVTVSGSTIDFKDSSDVSSVIAESQE